MKNLIIIAHPNIKKSKISSKIKQYFETREEDEQIILDLYEEYPDFKIDIKKEQKTLLEADNIVFVFPIQWYSWTPLLKQYIDDVFAYNFAYGPNFSLENKRWLAVTSSGRTVESYEELGKSLEELTEHINLTMEFVKLKKVDWINNFGAKKENINATIREIEKLI